PRSVFNLYPGGLCTPGGLGPERSLKAYQAAEAWQRIGQQAAVTQSIAISEAQLLEALAATVAPLLLPASLLSMVRCSRSSLNCLLFTTPLSLAFSLCCSQYLRSLHNKQW